MNDTDDRECAQTLFANIKRELSALEKIFEEYSSHWRYEDPIYRLYHGSFKVYRLQASTEAIVAALTSLSPTGKLNDDFMTIVRGGTGKEFDPSHNKRWLEVTRPIVEAFFHARYFLEMVVKYGREFHAPPAMLPSGWAAVLYLYDMR